MRRDRVRKLCRESVEERFYSICWEGDMYQQGFFAVVIGRDMKKKLK